MDRRTAAQPASSSRAGSDLPKRIAAGVVMAAAAVAAAWAGGGIFVLFWAVAAALVLWEWIGLTGRAPARMWWIAAGVIYAAVAVAAPVMLRADTQFGLIAILFLFAIVWSTDILGYVVGRLVGGSKLWPAVSPNKTWSGAVGGIIGAVAAGGAVAYTAGVVVWPAALLSGVLSVASQAGDLMESALKRKFDAKDASRIIPGHGGVMDRLDGFIVAALIAGAIGIARGGLDQPGRGLLAW